MVNYTNSELADIHYMYGLADGSARTARRLYQEKFPNRVTPDSRTFSNLHRRLAETGTFKGNHQLKGAHRTTRTPEIEEAVLNSIDENPTLSTRKIGFNLNISHFLVWKILHDFLLYPYHVQRVQSLLPRDFPLRINFCQWFLEMVAQNPLFDSEIMFTDEANFSRNAIRNFHNNHIWAEENPHAIVECNHQQQFSVNVWAAILGNYLIGPFFLPARLNGHTYRRFLEENLPILLEEVPIVIRDRMWLLHDGAPAHFSVEARNYLNRRFNNRWVGRGGPQAWPPRSPDLNSLDFFLWGHLKALVYNTPINNLEDLKDRIIDSCDIIRNTEGIFQRVRDNMKRRAQACIAAGGGHFQHFI